MYSKGDVCEWKVGWSGRRQHVEAGRISSDHDRGARRAATGMRPGIAEPDAGICQSIEVGSLGLLFGSSAIAKCGIKVDPGVIRDDQKDVAGREQKAESRSAKRVA